MHKDFPFKTINQSYMKQSSFQPSSPPSNSQSFYQPRPPTNYSTFSPQRMKHSFIGPSVSPPAQHFRLEQLPSKQPETIGSCLQIQHKENSRMLSRQSGASFQQMKVLEERMIQFERRMQRMQKQQRKSETLVKKVEQVMQLKLNDIKIIEDFEEKLDLLDQMIKHLKNTKLDRKQLQNPQLLNISLLQTEIKELWRQDEVNKNEIKDSKQLIQRLVSKVESSVMTIGQKYQEFIESNIIKSIEHVNKLTSHYHQEIQAFKSDFMKLKDKLQNVPRSTNLQLPAQTSLRMMEISIPNIKIVQSVTIINEKKTDSFSLFAKQPKSTSSMASYKNSLLNNLYDSIDKSTQSSSAELLLEKVIYKVDREFYLLDENDHYIVDAASNRVRLSNDHIKILEENGLIE